VQADFSQTLSIPESASEVLTGLYAMVSAPPPQAVKQGEHLRFEVNWFVKQAVPGARAIMLAVQRASDGSQDALWAGNPVHDTYPIRAWRPGQQVLDHYDVSIPANFAPGDYRLVLALGGASRPVFSLPLQVIAVARQFTAPALAHRVDLRFGDAITLLGYTVQKGSDQHVTVTLAWQARAVPAQDYTVFVHLANPDGTLFSQQDSPPSRPTSQWVVGEVIADTYTLAAPPGDTPPGAYSISVGLYLQDSGLRLPINTASGAPLGDELPLKLTP
jgi:hypothetical protein